MKLWTGVGKKLINLTMSSCEFPCRLDSYKLLVGKMLPLNEDRYCISDSCRLEHLSKLRPGSKSRSKIHFRDNEAITAFAVAGYGVLSMKYGIETLTVHPRNSVV